MIKRRTFDENVAKYIPGVRKLDFQSILLA